MWSERTYTRVIWVIVVGCVCMCAAFVMWLRTRSAWSEVCIIVGFCVVLGALLLFSHAAMREGVR